MRIKLLIFFSCFTILPVFSNWQKAITNYNRHTYKAGNQNWMLEQHRNGWIYVANNKGLLEYDGTSWNTYSIHNAKLRAVRCGKNDRIYVGGQMQFGYFTPNKLGGLDYTCLSLKYKKSEVGNIWNIHILDNTVFFQSDHSVFSLNANDSLTQIKCPDIMHSSVINNQLYVASSEGILKLDGKKFINYQNTSHIAKSKIIAMLPYKGRMLIVSSLNGIFLFDGKEAKPFHSAADFFIQANQLSCAAIKDSLLALGSMQNGLLTLNMETHQTEEISIGNGLQNKSILSLFFDNEKALWLGLDNGIDRIDLNSPMLFLYSNKSAIGSGYTSSFFKNKLFLGTNQGLYRINDPFSLKENKGIDFIPGTEGQVWSLLQYDGKLFCGGANALIITDGNKTSHIQGIRGIWNIAKLHGYPDRLLVGTYKGLYIIEKRDNGWSVRNRIEGIAFSAKTMFVEPESNAVWMANKEGGIHRVILSSDLKSARAKCLNSQHLPAGYNVYISRIANEIIIASRKGLLKYNRIKNRLEPYIVLEELLEGKTTYTYLKQDEYQNIWYVTNGELKIARYNTNTQSYHVKHTESFLKGLLIEDFEHINVIGDKAIAGTEEGFSLLYFRNAQKRIYPLNLQIRKLFLTMGKDSLVYGRSFSYDEHQKIIIPYKYNSIRIEYSVNDFSGATQFSYMLTGAGNETWSDFSGNSMKEFTNLKEGKYTFSVRILNKNEENPLIACISFRILPPWYRSWWAYTLYAILIALALAYLYRHLTKKQQAMILEKNKEINWQKQQNELKDQKISSLEMNRLQTIIEHKSKELISTTSNIVRKNEILQNIKKEAVTISQSISEGKLPDIRRKVLHLINQIDINIEHDADMQSFQEAFDSIHQDFFEKLNQQFPDLNKKDRMLCAYIRMDLMSKEIAPLMNISVRGVEIARYRLRKKLNLGSEENLAVFFQKI